VATEHHPVNTETLAHMIYEGSQVRVHES
jgi:hypothetical protein